MAEAGWYPDPADPRSLQYFDGQRWTGHRRPAASVGSSGAPAGDVATDQTTRIPIVRAPDQQRAQQPRSAQVPGRTPTQGGYGASAPPYGASTPPPNQFPPGGYWDEPPAKKSGRAKPKLIVAAAAVVIVALGVIGYFVFFSDDTPDITVGGKHVASISDFVSKTDRSVLDSIDRRNGAKNGDTRCYFAQPKKPAAGAKSSDVEDALRCGPVLFPDGKTSAAYLAVPFTSITSGNMVKLSVSGSLDTLQPRAVDTDDVRLVRPDGQTPPDGAGGLTVPSPAAAQKDALVATDLGPLTAPKSLTGATMIGKETKVTIKAAGEVSRYGSGSNARAAPPGQKLLAFQLQYGAGEANDSATSRAMLSVNGDAPRTIPDTSTDAPWNVAVIDKSATAVLELTDDGFTQTLSLPEGTPGSKNLQVLQRIHRNDYLGKTIKIPVRGSKGGRHVDFTWTATATLATIDFWVPGHEAAHPTATDKAYLAVRMTYYDSLEKKTYAFDLPFLHLKLPDGTTVSARNVSNTKDRVFNVFLVPANFTSGNVVVSGQEKVSGILVSVRKAATFPISIPSG